MAFIPAVNTARVTIHQRLHGQVVRNVLHVQKASAWDEASLVALANTVITWWNDFLADHLSVNIGLESVSARDMATEEGLGVEIAAPPLSGGNVANPAMPGNVAFAIKHKTGFSGRNRQGRSYVAGLPENAQEGNEITLAVRDALVDAFETLLAELLSQALTMVVASFFDGTVLTPLPNGETVRRPIPRVTALLTPIASFIGEINLDSQRRRLTGRGI